MFEFWRGNLIILYRLVVSGTQRLRGAGPRADALRGEGEVGQRGLLAAGQELGHHVGPARDHGERPRRQPSLAQLGGGVQQGRHDLGLGRLVEVALRDEPRRGRQDPANSGN